MDLQVIDYFQDFGYPRELSLNDGSLDQLLESWVDYSQAVAWISGELKLVMKTEESVNDLTNPSDVNHFFVELSSLLNELGCPYSLIMALGDTKSRFDTREKRLLTLYFLLTELCSSGMTYDEKSQPMEIESEGNPEEKLNEIFLDLGLGKPPKNLTFSAIWSDVKKRSVERREKLRSAGIELAPIVTGQLSENQWGQLEELNNQFHDEYQIRREMLLKRLDVTIQSFHWSDRLADKREVMSRIFSDHRSGLVAQPNVKLSDVLAARADLAIIEKTSSASVRKNTKSAINSVKIGGVPDRGGRPSETQAPAKEMPSWQQRQAGSVGWRKSGGGGGGYDGRTQRGGGGRGGGQTTPGRRESGSGYSGEQLAHYGTNEGWNERGGGFQSPRGGGQPPHRRSHGGGEFHSDQFGGNRQGEGHRGSGEFSQSDQFGDNRQGQQRHRGGGRVQGGWSHR